MRGRECTKRRRSGPVGRPKTGTDCGVIVARLRAGRQAELIGGSNSATEGWWGSKREKKTPGKQRFPRETRQKDFGRAFSRGGVHQESRKAGGISRHGSDERGGDGDKAPLPQRGCRVTKAENNTGRHTKSLWCAGARDADPVPASQTG